MTVRNSLWVEKYRPTSLEHLALSDENRALLEKCLSAGEVPNLLLSGPPGQGKTTIADVVASTLDCRVLLLNASKDRGIDVIRDRIGVFAQSKMVARWNLVILDEADALTKDAQNSMRNLMEQYSDYTRFILTANYVHKIISPIRSRCVELQLANLPSKSRATVLARILKAEGIAINKEIVLGYAEIYTDLRRMINAAQKSVLTHGTLHPTRPSLETSPEELWALIEGKKWDSLVEISKDENTDHIELLKTLFWAVPDSRKNAATLRAIVEEKLSTSSFTPDPVINFLGTCAALIKEL